MTIESPFFFENKTNRRLFGILHECDAKKAERLCGAAIIYCHPLFEEKLHSHRVMVNFARYAANRGIHVLRFDYFGDGESEGFFEEASISSRISDIFAAIRIAEDRLQASKIFLLGLRLGATLALLASGNHEMVAGIAAWSPIIKGKEYIHTMLRVNLSKQMIVHKKILYNSDALIEKITLGELVNVDGYEISNSLFSEAINIDLVKEPKKTERPIFLVQISPSQKTEKQMQEFLNSSKHGKVHFKIVNEKKFWDPQKVLYSSCEELFSTTVNWISDICRQ